MLELVLRNGPPSTSHHRYRHHQVLDKTQKFSQQVRGSIMEAVSPNGYTVSYLSYYGQPIEDILNIWNELGPTDMP